jgi:hypothetical protein
MQHTYRPHKNSTNSTLLVENFQANRQPTVPTVELQTVAQFALLYPVPKPNENGGLHKKTV